VTSDDRVRRLIHEDVVVVPYDPLWPELFERETVHLLSCFADGVIRRVEHFGSTAVPGLAAKPIVDMLVEVSSLEAPARSRLPERSRRLHGRENGFHQGSHGAGTSAVAITVRLKADTTTYAKPPQGEQSGSKSV
jgi:GrpB-like predicted nucleotidyltransferase (UPF0157 family)